MTNFSRRTDGVRAGGERGDGPADVAWSGLAAPTRGINQNP
jgi:hypothetical protein